MLTCVSCRFPDWHECGSGNLTNWYQDGMGSLIFCECLHTSLTWWNLNPGKYTLTKRSLMFCECLDASMIDDGGLGLFPYMLQSQWKDPHVSTRLDLQLETYITILEDQGYNVYCLVSFKYRWTIDDVYIGAWLSGNLSDAFARLADASYSPRNNSF